LLVEDDHESRLLLSFVLSHAGYSVVTAEDGQQALDLLDRGVRPTAMVVDLLLPRVGGAHVLRQVASEPDLRDIVTVAVSGDEAALERAIVDATLLKPFDPYGLVSLLEELLETRRPPFVTN
jgi:CheY-like chemotaxis protein